MRLKKRLNLSPPYICGREREHVERAFAENWIAPLGPNVRAFEAAIAQSCGMPYAVATDSGTAAIHLALRYLGVGPGDLVFCSDFTFAASCNPILYQGAEPVFIDSEPESWNMSPWALEEALRWAKAANRLPKAIIIVDLYGLSANYDALLPLCQAYGVTVIEDAAEALGSTYRGKACGSFGPLSVLSFNGNKIVTCSGGGMLLAREEAAAQKALFWATQAREPAPYYEHREYGYNYRLSNVSAGIGLGQFEKLNEKIAKRKEKFARYAAGFANTGIRMMPKPTASGDAFNHWMTVVCLPEPIDPLCVWKTLEQANIESRPAWKPMHLQPLYSANKFFSHDGKNAFDSRIFERGLCLPSGEAMTEDEQALVIDLVQKACKS